MSPAEAIAAYRKPICAVIQDERSRGPVKRAIGVAARFYGLPERRVRATWHNEVREVLAHEMENVRRGYRRWLLEKQNKLAAENERLEREIAELGGDGAS